MGRRYASDYEPVRSPIPVWWWVAGAFAVVLVGVVLAGLLFAVVWKHRPASSPVANLLDEKERASAPVTNSGPSEVKPPAPESTRTLNPIRYRITFRDIPNEHVADYLASRLRYEVEPPPPDPAKMPTGNREFPRAGRIVSVSAPTRGTLQIVADLWRYDWRIAEFLENLRIGPCEQKDRDLMVTIDPNPVPFEVRREVPRPLWRSQPPKRESVAVLRTAVRQLGIKLEARDLRTPATVLAEAIVIEAVRDEIRKALKAFIPICTVEREREAAIIALAIWGTADDDEFLAGELQRTPERVRTVTGYYRVAAYLPSKKALPFLLDEMEAKKLYNQNVVLLLLVMGREMLPEIHRRLPMASGGARTLYLTAVREMGTVDSIAVIKPLAINTIDNNETYTLWSIWRTLALRSAFGPHELPPMKKTDK